MFLLEHDAKTLLAAHGIPVPAGVLLERAGIERVTLPPAPWMVKAQIAAGGRGKAGLVRSAGSDRELASHLRDMLGATHQGLRVGACRVESQVPGATEAYLSFMLDPVAAGVRIIVSARGGVEIEAVGRGAIRSVIAAPTLEELTEHAARLTSEFSPHLAKALDDAARSLARVFLDAELSLLEINPLFILPEGCWVAGDAKIVTDDDALFRQPRLRSLLAERGSAYPEAQRKLLHGCDYVVIDPQGEIGLLTTGAGLSMMLIDELRAAGLKPYNFLDVRTGGLRGDATRLIDVLNWIAEGARVRVLLVNIFAGITDLAEFSRLLVEAFTRTPQFRVPVVARLLGNGLDAARDYLATHDIAVVTDLGDALAHVRRHLA